MAGTSKKKTGGADGRWSIIGRSGVVLAAMKYPN